MICSASPTPRCRCLEIDPDARRRRLTALINTATLSRTEPVLYIIEDVHWIDAVSESMLADFLTVIPHTPLMVLITARPEYQGALIPMPGAQTIALAPLGDSDTAALLGELLGSDPSVDDLAAVIAERAAGNPFSPRRWYASWCSAGCWLVTAVATSVAWMWPTSRCRPRCRRPSRRASTG